jgi:hypothetical protein
MAKTILEVLLFDMVEDDKLVWYDDDSGNYSVKSGYNLLLKYIGRVKVLYTSKGIGRKFGKFMLHQKLRTYFGGFVREVY